MYSIRGLFGIGQVLFWGGAGRHFNANGLIVSEKIDIEQSAGHILKNFP
jgi:hypothetical protein